MAKAAHMECSFTKLIPRLAKNEIHVWVVQFSHFINRIKELEQVLSSDEMERAYKFRFQEHRDQYITARGCLRLVLARYLAADPIRLRFNYNSFGKPFVAPEYNREELAFSHAHKSGLDLIAITQEKSVGIDIEQIRGDLTFEDIARHFFSPAETSSLLSLSQSMRKETFYRYWTLKEAYLKATGLGLSKPLDHFDVILPSAGSPILLITRPDPEEASKWSLQSLEINKSYAAAVAIQGRIENIHYFDFQKLA
jgi:4'-phosphopantetheinyl transferase